MNGESNGWSARLYWQWILYNSVAFVVVLTDRERDREPERRQDPDPLAAVEVGLGHHHVGEHGEDRPGREREHESDYVRGRMLEPRSTWLTRSQVVGARPGICSRCEYPVA